MEFSGFPYLSAILLSCVAGLMAILLIPAANPRAVKLASAVFSGATLALSLVVFLKYDRELGGLQFVERAAWVPSLGIQYLNAVDGFSLPMVLLTGIVFFTGVLTMWELEHRVKEFFAFYFLLVTGVFGLFMTLDLFFIFIWYDVSLFPMYPLIAIWGSTAQGVRGDEADPVPAGRQRAHPAGHHLPARAGRRHHLRPHGPHAARHLFGRPTRSWPSCCSTSASASWPPCGPSTPGRRSATWPPRPRSAWCTRASS